MNITEFLLARIAEDEAAVAVFPGRQWTFDGGDVRDDVTDNPYVPWGRTVLEVGFEGVCQSGIEDHVARYDPSRVLAECAAKRAIIASHDLYVAYSGQEGRDREGRDQMWNYALTVRESLKALAAVYADHPDYDRNWRL